MVPVVLEKTRLSARFNFSGIIDSILICEVSGGVEIRAAWPKTENGIREGVLSKERLF